MPKTPPVRYKDGRAAEAWLNGYEQACKDTRTEQMTMSEFWDELAQSGQLQLPDAFKGPPPDGAGFYGPSEPTGGSRP